MARLIYRNKVILKEMKYLTSLIQISFGLMFASKNKIKKGVCLVMPFSNKSKLSSAITMFFVFYPLEILFLDEKFVVVDKVVLNPWRGCYVPKKRAKYVIESSKNSFREINLGDKLKIEI